MARGVETLVWAWTAPPPTPPFPHPRFIDLCCMYLLVCPLRFCKSDFSWQTFRSFIVAQNAPIKQAFLDSLNKTQGRENTSLNKITKNSSKKLKVSAK